MQFPIRVIVRCAETHETVHDRTGDHADKGFRKWIGSTSFWALRNNHYVMTGPYKELEQ